MQHDGTVRTDPKQFGSNSALQLRGRAGTPKPLFLNILAASPVESRFCQPEGISPPPNCKRISILPGSSKKKIDVYPAGVKRSGRRPKGADLHSRQGQLQQPGGVEVGALPADGDVKMRAGGSAGATAEADFLAAGYGVSFFHFEFGEVEVEGEESLAVVDHHAVAFEIEKAGQQHGAGIHGRDRGSGGDAEIQALMFALGHAVEDSLRTVDVRYGSFGGRGEVAVPSAVGRDAIQIVLLDLLAFLGLL